MTMEDPVVLLDDVLSELDEGRRSCVLAVIGGYQQVLLTTTDTELNDTRVAAAARFLVQGGTVTPLPG
jgi:recombinational DNA repair ATPase RecF